MAASLERFAAPKTRLKTEYPFLFQFYVAAVREKQRPGLVGSELRPETWTRLMVAVMRLPVGPDPGILPGSGP